MINFIDGDIIKLSKAGTFHSIAHGCNCFCVMGAGVALAIRKAYPIAYEVDCNTVRGDKSKLGTCSVAVDMNLTIFNAYTQYKPGANFDLNAFKSCMKFIYDRTDRVKRLGVPMIGAGIGGGNWEDILQAIDTTFHDKPITIVRYKP